MPRTAEARQETRKAPAWEPIVAMALVLGYYLGAMALPVGWHGVAYALGAATWCALFLWWWATGGPDGPEA